MQNEIKRQKGTHEFELYQPPVEQDYFEAFKSFCVKVKTGFKNKQPFEEFTEKEKTVGGMFVFAIIVLLVLLGKALG